MWKFALIHSGSWFILKTFQPNISQLTREGAKTTLKLWQGAFRKQMQFHFLSIDSRQNKKLQQLYHLSVAQSFTFIKYII